MHSFDPAQRETVPLLLGAQFTLWSIFRVTFVAACVCGALFLDPSILECWLTAAAGIAGAVTIVRLDSVRSFPRTLQRLTGAFAILWAACRLYVLLTQYSYEGW
jgi:hypothetical protein